MNLESLSKLGNPGREKEIQKVREPERAKEPKREPEGARDKTLKHSTFCCKNLYNLSCEPKKMS